MARITVNIASIPERVDLLINTINSLIDQVDQVNLALNNYTSNPYKHPKVNAVFTKNVFGDAAKFMFAEKESGFYFTCDDDIIYSDTYIKDTIKRFDAYSSYILTYHGRSFYHFPINDYYNTPCEKVRCMSESKDSKIVQFGGTGVMAFRLDEFKPIMQWFKRKNMADIWIGIEADKRKIPIIALKHSKDYFEYQPPMTTIYDEKVRNCSIETDIINNYFIHTKKS